MSGHLRGGTAVFLLDETKRRLGEACARESVFSYVINAPVVRDAFDICPSNFAALE